MKNNETDRLRNIIYENNPKNITDYRKIMNFDKKIAKYPTKLFFCRTDIVIIKLKEKCKIIIHGLEIEENMSFLFYYFNFCYMDTFLYISFVDKIEPE